MKFPSSDVRQTFTEPLSYPLISYANAPQLQTNINAGTFIKKKAFGMSSKGFLQDYFIRHLIQHHSTNNRTSEIDL
jgi:hypothetical protein